jgi:hypothetical protein
MKFQPVSACFTHSPQRLSMLCTVVARHPLASGFHQVLRPAPLNPPPSDVRHRVQTSGR